MQQSQHAAGKQRGARWQFLDLAPCDVLNVTKVPSSGHARPASRLVRKSAGRPRNKSASEGNSVPLNWPRSNSYPSPAWPDASPLIRRAWACISSSNSLNVLNSRHCDHDKPCKTAERREAGTQTPSLTALFFPPQLKNSLGKTQPRKPNCFFFYRRLTSGAASAHFILRSLFSACRTGSFPTFRDRHSKAAEITI